MEAIILENGEKKVTHLRCVNRADGKHRSLAVVIAHNSAMMETLGFYIEDPEHDIYLSSLKQVEKIEVIEDIPFIESELTEAPKRGREPKIK